MITIKNMSDLHTLISAETDRAIVMDFYADWCGPCKAIAPFFTSFSNSEVAKSVCFVKVDVDDAEDVAAHFKVAAMPTFIGLKNGQEVARVTGANKTELGQMIANVACQT